MVYLAAVLLMASVLFGGLFFFKNFTFSARSTDVFPSIYRISEANNNAVPTPEIIQRVDLGYSKLNWNSSDDNFVVGMFIPLTYTIYAYEAKLDDTTSVRVEFCKAGQADVKKMVGKNKVSEEPVWPQYADTYVFKLLRNGTIVDSWAYKELDLEGSKKYVVVEQSQLPIIKSLYHKVRELHPQS